MSLKEFFELTLASIVGILLGVIFAQKFKPVLPDKLSHRRMIYIGTIIMCFYLMYTCYDLHYYVICPFVVLVAIMCVILLFFDKDK